MPMASRHQSRARSKVCGDENRPSQEHRNGQEGARSFVEIHQPTVYRTRFLGQPRGISRVSPRDRSWILAPLSHRVLRAKSADWVPPGVPHGFAKPIVGPAKTVVLSSPAAVHERYFEELAEILPKPGPLDTSRQ